MSESPETPTGVVVDEPMGRALLYAATAEGLLDNDPTIGDGFVGRLMSHRPSQEASEESGVEDPLTAYADDPGAQVFRACIACHTLEADQGNRAGPTLHGIFGRRIATLPGYNFSEALNHLDIVWTPETVANQARSRYSTYSLNPSTQAATKSVRPVGFLRTGLWFEAEAAK